MDTHCCHAWRFASMFYLLFQPLCFQLFYDHSLRLNSCNKFDQAFCWLVRAVSASPRPLNVSRLLPSIPTVGKAVGFEVCVCGWVHGRMAGDGNKLRKVFQDGVSKAHWLIMMTGILLMGVLIDAKQMAACSMGYTTTLGRLALPSAGTQSVPGESDEVEVCMEMTTWGWCLLCALTQTSC